MKKMLPVLMLIAFLAFAISCDALSEDDEDDVVGAGDFDVVPLNMISGGFIYLLHGKVEESADDQSDARIVVVPLDSDEEIELDITRHEKGIITASVPDDMHESIPNGGDLYLKVDGESYTNAHTVFAMENSGFGGRAQAGMGLLGTVYALLQDTSALPTASDWCDDAAVVTDSAHPCPFTSFLVDKLDVPVTSFTNGFPGLGTDLLEWFAIDFQGYIDVPDTGEYAFESCSDDGSKVYLDGEMVVDIDGIHGMGCAEGTVTLDAGLHEIKVDYFQGPMYEIGLQLSWTPPGGSKVIVPAANLYLFEDY